MISSLKLSQLLPVCRDKQTYIFPTNLLTGGEGGADNSASLGTGKGLQPDGVLRGGGQLSHVVRHSSGTQNHLLRGKWL